MVDTAQSLGDGGCVGSQKEKEWNEVQTSVQALNAPRRKEVVVSLRMGCFELEQEIWCRGRKGGDREQRPMGVLSQ